MGGTAPDKSKPWPWGLVKVAGCLRLLAADSEQKDIEIRRSVCEIWPSAESVQTLPWL